MGVVPPEEVVVSAPPVDTSASGLSRNQKKKQRQKEKRQKEKQQKAQATGKGQAISAPQ